MKSTRVAVLVALLGGLGSSAAVAQIGPIERVSLTSAFDSTDWKQVEVECPPGTIAFSGGASLAFGTNPDLPIIIHQSLPVGDPPTAWLALAQELVPTAMSWAVNSYALCAPIDGYELVEESSAFDSAELKLVTVDCPPGKSPIGGGGGIFFFNPDLALFSVTPTDTGWLAAARESSPVAGNWLLNVKVSCAPAVDLERILAGTGFATENRDELWLQCNSPRVLVGGGVTVEHAFHGAWPESSIRWQVDGRRISGTAAWTLIGSIVCYLPPLFFDGFESGDTSAWPAP